MNLLSLMPVLLSFLGNNKPGVEAPIKTIIDIIGKLSQPELQENIEPVNIRVAQEKLSGLGYDVGPIDGFAGELTRKAVLKYQEENGLLADGLIGQRTYRRLVGGV